MASPAGAGSAGVGEGAAGGEPHLPPGIRWGETAYPLKEFATKHPLPNIVRVTKGQYRNIGVAKSVANELYLHSIKTSKKVLAEGVKVKEGKRITTVDQKFSLPVTYQGWFELLSEDGRAIKPVQGVQELARVFPQRCLVRESIMVHLASRETGDVSQDLTRVLATGEQLSLVGDVFTAASPGAKGPTRRKMLKCFDQQGESVYLGTDQKGMFSPIAGQGNISGVHNIKALLEKFRLPIMVRLVHGIIPSRLDKGSFTGVFRLLSVYSDETAFVCPMRKDAKMVPISTREPLKIIAMQNFPELQEQDEVRFYHMRCGKMIASYLNSIHVLVNPPEPTRITGRAWGDQEVFHRPGHGEGGSTSPGQQVGRGTPPGAVKGKGPTEEDILFDEIDDIYQFVRDGGRPPPPRPRPPHLRKSDPSPVLASATNGTTSDQRPLSQGNPRFDPNLKSKRTASKGDLLRPSDHRPGVATAIISKTGSIDILNSSASASPEDTSPATTLSYQRQEKDEHYWEEPIYEEIDKYRKAAAAAAAAAIANKNQDSGSPSSPLRSGNGLRDGPVENLRQMYKLQNVTMLSGSRMSFADTADDLSGDEDGKMAARYEPTYQSTPFLASATSTSPGSLSNTLERRQSQGEAFSKWHDVPALYQTGQPPSADEFKSVHDRIASINRVNTQGTGAIGGVSTSPVVTNGSTSPEVHPGGAIPPSGVRRYIRATTVYGNAGRSHGSPNPQFMAVAHVGASSTRSSGRGASQKGPLQGPSPPPSTDLSGRDRPERHSERSPRTGYTRVENLRRKLQGLYL